MNPLSDCVTAIPMNSYLSDWFVSSLPKRLILDLIVSYEGALDDECFI